MSKQKLILRIVSMLMMALVVLTSGILTAFAEVSQPINYVPSSTSELQEEFNNGNLLLFFGQGGDAADIGTEEASDAADTGGVDEDGEQVDVDLGDVLDDVLTEEEQEAEPEPEAPEDPFAGEVIAQGRIIGTNINLRAEPDMNGEVVAALNEGATVNIHGTIDEWLVVSFGIIQGYVHNSNVFQLSEIGLNGTILSDGVNLREYGSTEAPAVGKLDCGNGVQVLDYVDGWYKVRFNGMNGFVRNDCIYVTGEFTGETATRLLKSGMSGAAVTSAQKELMRRGFLTVNATGTYASKTERAVKDFQKAAGISADGMLGPETLNLLYGSNNIRVTIAQSNQVKGRVQLSEWSKINSVIPRGATFTVIDVNTGTSFKERRKGGYNHIDAEPLTAADTVKLKKLYGGKWSWNRRAVWVIYGSRVYAASMNGMPHGNEAIGASNNFTGHHCFHFYKSKGHASGKECSIHQSMVKKAYNAGK
ncbi:MAG: SH3 domain-containing protein [Clostridia bacterium]|nr:SH3 domain-containing protein [Clostridia bacterium]